jgi:hypothetical protein
LLNIPLLKRGIPKLLDLRSPLLKAGFREIKKLKTT